jgi:hypothetical protein
VLCRSAYGELAIALLSFGQRFRGSSQRADSASRPRAGRGDRYPRTCDATFDGHRTDHILCCRQETYRIEVRHMLMYQNRLVAVDTFTTDACAGEVRCHNSHTPYDRGLQITPKLGVGAIPSHKRRTSFIALLLR